MRMEGSRCRTRSAVYLFGLRISKCAKCFPKLADLEGRLHGCVIVERFAVLRPDACPNFAPTSMARESPVPCEISKRSMASQRPFSYFWSSSPFVKRLLATTFWVPFSQDSADNDVWFVGSFDTSGSLTLAASLRTLSWQKNSCGATGRSTRDRSKRPW